MERQTKILIILAEVVAALLIGSYIMKSLKNSGGAFHAGPSTSGDIIMLPRGVWNYARLPPFLTNVAIAHRLLHYLAGAGLEQFVKPGHGRPL